ncbi:MAG: hypothetical protein ACTSPN_15315 [Promethearchaeota archaeon]
MEKNELEDLKEIAIGKIKAQDAVDSANTKLQKFCALRTCEAWLKFD